MIDLYKSTPLALDGSLLVDGLFIPFKEGWPLMQYTGIPDKNGNDIYEGDILKLSGRGQDCFFAVDFEEGCFVARVPWKKEYSPELKCYTFFSLEVMSVEIVGNIYENPDLLKP